MNFMDILSGLGQGITNAGQRFGEQLQNPSPLFALGMNLLHQPGGYGILPALGGAASETQQLLSKIAQQKLGQRMQEQAMQLRQHESDIMSQKAEREKTQFEQGQRAQQDILGALGNISDPTRQAFARYGIQAGQPDIAAKAAFPSTFNVDPTSGMVTESGFGGTRVVQPGTTPLQREAQQANIEQSRMATAAAKQQQYWATPEGMATKQKMDLQKQQALLSAQNENELAQLDRQFALKEQQMNKMIELGRDPSTGKLLTAKAYQPNPIEVDEAKRIGKSFDETQNAYIQNEPIISELKNVISQSKTGRPEAFLGWMANTENFAKINNLATLLTGPFVKQFYGGAPSKEETSMVRDLVSGGKPTKQNLDILDNLMGRFTATMNMAQAKKDYFYRDIQGPAGPRQAYNTRGFGKVLKAPIGGGYKNTYYIGNVDLPDGSQAEAYMEPLTGVKYAHIGNTLKRINLQQAVQ